MPRRNNSKRTNVKVTREVYALATLAQLRADSEAQEHLAVRAQGSRRITGRMLKRLRAQVV